MTDADSGPPRTSDSPCAQEDVARKRQRVMKYPRLYRLHGETQLPDPSMGIDKQQPGMWHLQTLSRCPSATRFQLPRCPVRLPPDPRQALSSATAGPADQQSTQNQVSIMRGQRELNARLALHKGKLDPLHPAVTDAIHGSAELYIAELGDTSERRGTCCQPGCPAWRVPGSA